MFAGLGSLTSNKYFFDREEAQDPKLFNNYVPGNKGDGTHCYGSRAGKAL